MKLLDVDRWRARCSNHPAAAGIDTHSFCWQPAPACCAADSLTHGATHATRSSADLIDYTAEEGLRSLGQGELLNSDSFPGQKRDKMCLVSKVRVATIHCSTLSAAAP